VNFHTFFEMRFSENPVWVGTLRYPAKTGISTSILCTTPPPLLSFCPLSFVSCSLSLSRSRSPALNHTLSLTQCASDSESELLLAELTMRFLEFSRISSDFLGFTMVSRSPFYHFIINSHLEFHKQTKCVPTCMVETK